MNQNHTTTNPEHGYYEAAHIFRLLKPALEALRQQSPAVAFDVPQR